MALISPRGASRVFLRGLLLGADAADVRRKHGQCRMDARIGLRDGDRKEHALGTQAECAAWDHPACLGQPDRAQPFLHLASVRNVRCARRCVGSLP